MDAVNANDVLALLNVIAAGEMLMAEGGGLGKDEPAFSFRSLSHQQY